MAVIPKQQTTISNKKQIWDWQINQKEKEKNICISTGILMHV